MLPITVPGRELWDEENNEFLQTKEKKLQLEHSLISISKWESKWKIPFLESQPLTRAQFIDYVRCMTINNVDPDDDCYLRLDGPIMEKISDYINDTMTASTFPNRGKKGQRVVITSERVYAWMAILQIPFSCEKWHFNRLMTLIRACDALQQPAQKMSRKDEAAQRRALNASRNAHHRSRR